MHGPPQTSDRLIIDDEKVKGLHYQGYSPRFSDEMAEWANRFWVVSD